MLLLLLLPVYAQAEDLYHLRRLPEKELLRTYTSLMRDACHHADQFWQEWPSEPGAGLWGSGRSDNMNEGIRAISEMVFTCGVLLKYSDVLTETQRKEYSRKAIAAIRYAVSTHLTGTLKCTDGKPWGGSWQSAMWTGTLGFGAWLLWEDLEPGLRKEVERVVASEADRFLEGKPPGGTWGDTKAEENGWNLICISIGANMFPAHPHAPAWNQKALEYMINTLSAPQDRQDSGVVDGRPVSEWFSGANVYPDFTLENHGFFHPSYVACSSYFLTQTAMHYTYAHRPIPQAATHHLMDTWRMLRTMILPCAESAFPQGMDWELHGLPFINLYASLATYQQDPLAARMEQTALQYMRAWQTRAHGDLTVPGSRLGFTRHAICAEQAAYGFLAHQLFGAPVKEMAAGQAASLVAGVRSYDWVQLITHRTANKFASFSWTNRLMGMVIPIAPGHEGNPEFTVPILNGLVGSFELAPRGDTKARVLEHSWREMTNGFETTGTVLLNGGRLKQTIRVTSVGEKTLVYQDCVTALAEVSVTREQGVPVGIENDELTGGQRVVFHQGGKIIFDWQHPQPPVQVPGSWVNVDGRLGAVRVAGAGTAYIQAAKYHPQMAVCSDTLCASFSAGRRQFQPGEEVARRTALLFVEVTAKETAALAASFNIQESQNGRTLRFNLPEGGEGRVRLF